MGKARIVAVALACAAATQAVALGAGPSPGVAQGGDGIARGDVRYVALPNGTDTIVATVRRDGGRIVRSRALRGSWGIPLVSFDGTPGGLSADGRRLFLADVDSVDPRATRTSLLVLGTKRLRVLQTVRLKGGFSFDALSPDARRVYLIEHLYANEDPTHYRVRMYDLQTRRLSPRVITDKTNWDTDMQGMPISRLSYAGWAYTLYGGPGPRTFIHALDTRNAVARCIFLPWKRSPNDVFDYRLGRDGDGHLVVRGRHGRALAVVDMNEKTVLSSVANP
jgi:hypothetical protein